MSMFFPLCGDERESGTWQVLEQAMHLLWVTGQWAHLVSHGGFAVGAGVPGDGDRLAVWCEFHLWLLLPESPVPVESRVLLHGLCSVLQCLGQHVAVCDDSGGISWMEQEQPCFLGAQCL